VTNRDAINSKGVNRRDFMKETAAGVGVVAAAGSGLLSKQVAQAGTAESGALQGTVPQIPPSQIKETIATDVVVVGMGISGMCAALSAIDGGAKTVILEKGAQNNARGFDDGCVNSSVHKEAGIHINREELIGELMKQANYRVDQRLITTWVDKSGEAIDWLRAKVEPKGQKPTIAAASYSMVQVAQDQEGPYKVYRTAVNWPGMNAAIMSIVEAEIREKGGDVRFQTPAVQLIREGTGRVTGVIAKTPAGVYLRFNARKGIILSCGGYDNNPEMMKRYLRPADLRIEKFNSQNQLCTGDGHNMGLAIGADMDEPPHCMIVGNGVIQGKVEFYTVMFTPFLRVDKLGRRYVNEDSDYCRAANANSVLPGAFHWSVLDSSNEDGAKQMTRHVASGAIFTADTIEELAKKMEVVPGVFKATIDRYNQMAKNKKDEDFGVYPEKMRPVVKAPFYAMQVRNFALVTISGLKINENMQVLDKEGKVIPGLYASGNTSGGFFADTYPRNVHGISHGRAITFGRIAAKHAAAQKG
jgi:fumarate reductase flavoprotein subunit